MWRWVSLEQQGDSEQLLAPHVPVLLSILKWNGIIFSSQDETNVLGRGGSFGQALSFLFSRFFFFH